MEGYMFYRWNFRVSRHRTLLFIAVSIALLLILNKGATTPVESYVTGTHQQLNRLGAQLVENNDTNSIYEEVYQDPHVQRLGQGGIDEDDTTGVPGFCAGGRYMQHFYQPASGLGLPSTFGQAAARTPSPGLAPAAMT
jgi:hypothetical protein